MKVPVRNAEGAEVRTLEVDESVFGIQPNTAVLHQAFVAGRANQRWGTAQTKTRGEVQGSTRKVRRQKYTGAARQGSARAPHRVGGGIVFGPRLRDYSQALPKKMRRLAIRSALSGKLADGQLVVIDQFAFETPKTKEIIQVLRNVGIERSALIVTGQPDRTVQTSARNLARTKVLPAAYLNVVDMMNHNGLLMTEEAVRVAEQLWGRKAAPAEAPARTEPRRRAARAAAVVEPAEAPAAVAPKRRAPKGAAAAAAPPAKPEPKRRAPRARAAAERTEAPVALAPMRRAVQLGDFEAVAESHATVAEPPAKRGPKRRAAKAPAETAAAEAKPKRAPRRKPEPEAAQTAAEEPPKPRRRARKTKEGEA